MDALYQTIFEETKVQQAASEAEAIRDAGKRAAAEGNRAGAEQAIADLTSIRDTLRQEYTAQVVNRAGAKSGFWTFPEINTEATNYYVVVEALDPRRQAALSLPILNEENGQTETVTIWGVRVPERSIAPSRPTSATTASSSATSWASRNSAFSTSDYVMPVLGGAVTRW